jgi:hypothetical protein
MKYIIYKRVKPKDTTFRDWNFIQVSEIELSEKEIERLVLQEYLSMNGKCLEEGMFAEREK